MPADQTAQRSNAAPGPGQSHQLPVHPPGAAAEWSRGCFYHRRVPLTRIRLCRWEQTGLIPATAARSKLLAPLPKPALDPLPLPGRRIMEAAFQLLDALAQPMATLPIPPLHRQDVRDCRGALRRDRTGFRPNRNGDQARDQQAGENCGFQHGLLDLLVADTITRTEPPIIRGPPPMPATR